MAEAQEHEPGHDAGAKPKKGQHRDNMIIIVVSVVLTIITFLIYRGSKKAPTSTTSGLPSTGGTVAGGLSSSAYDSQYLQQIAAQLGAGQDQALAHQSAALAGFQGYLDTLAAEIAAMQPKVVPPAQQTSSVDASTPTSIASHTPANLYRMDQVVNPGSGERIVDIDFSQLYGWLDTTNLGGIYQGGGGSGDVAKGPFGGSYLGYAATTPNPAGEVAAHGNFQGAGATVVLPGGGYVMTNAAGEQYTFGS